MKLLITGAPGWFGTRLVKSLHKRGYIVRCLVLEGEDISDLKRIGAEIIYGDITKPATLNHATNEIDIIVHACGIIHPKMFKISMLYAINRDGTKNILKAAVLNKVKKIIYISSNAAVGFNKKRDKLLTEKDVPKPYTPYGHSKYQAEKIVQKYQKSGKIETVILRPCWFYGPGQPKRQTTLMKMIQNSRPILFGDGNNLRSMTHIDNLVHATILSIEKTVANGQIYWISDEKPYTMNYIYNTIAKQLKVKIKPKKIPYIVSNIMELTDIILSKLGIYIIQLHVGGEMVRNITCSVDKAKKELGYEPKFTLEEGMESSIKWAQKRGYLR